VCRCAIAALLVVSLAVVAPLAAQDIQTPCAGCPKASFGSALRFYRASSASSSLTSIAIGDFNGDGIPDVAAASGNYPSGITVWLGSPEGALGSPQFYILSGYYTTYVVTADFDGDGNFTSQDGTGRADYGIFRPSSGTWYVKSSQTLTEQPSVSWGISGDVPLPSNMSGDVRADKVVWRPSNGTWYVLSAEGASEPAVIWRTSGDSPLTR
jgi:hypothetical protein